MAQEKERGCGFRVVGAMYLVGEFIPVECDRLPYPLDVCPVCGGGVKVSRAFTRINPLALFGEHKYDDCIDDHHPCRMCDPTDEVAYIMRVGKQSYPTPGHFIAEGMDMGISKKIPFIPKELKVGQTSIYLAHPRACVNILQPEEAVQEAEAIVKGEDTPQGRLIDAERVEYSMGIFAAFSPQRIELLIWQHDARPETLKKLEKRGITPVIIRDGDLDHARSTSLQGVTT